MTKHFLAALFLLLSLTLFAQEEQDSIESIGDRIFLPSVDVGYGQNFSNVLSGGVILKTSIEIRYRNNNDFFFRANYDAYDAQYRFENVNGTSNIINGEVFFTDLLGGIGYRFGEKKLRYFLLFQPGVKFYNFPTATIEGNVITIGQDRSNIFTTRATIGFEYYFNEKAAFCLDVFQSQIYKRVDFWEDRGDAIGISVGVITALL